ncbi:MAG: hypothetical protein V4459_11350 [Pseudomonadota bacterium]
MKTLFAIALIAAATPAFAQTTTAPAPVAAASAGPTVSGAGAPVVGAKFTTDTPIETIMADAKGKEVLTADLGGDPSANPYYESFKTMSLKEVAPMSQGKITDELLVKLSTDLSAIK